jgi:hypothetical protein
MREFLSFPCSHVFQKPFECRMIPGVSYPLSLIIIRDRLTSGVYTDPSDWVRDMNTLFRSMMSPMSEDPNGFLVAYLAEDYLRRLRKRTRRLFVLTPEGWLRSTERLNLKLARLMQHAPRLAAQHFPVLQGPPPDTKRLNAAQYDFVMRMCPRISSPLDMLRLSRILETDPSAGVTMADSEIRVDLAQLAMPTACEIFDLLRHLFPDEAVELPTLEAGFTARIPVL